MSVEQLKLWQSDYLRTIEPSDIPSGATVPNFLFTAYLETGAVIVDFGGGTGHKAKKLTLLGYKTYVVDINPQALAHASILGMPVILSDVTNSSESAPKITDMLGNRPVDAVIMEALLCNLPFSAWTQALVTAHQVLKPQGHLFIADVLEAGEQNRLVREQLSFFKYLVWRFSWQQRYKHNADLGLPKGTFVVAKPGTNKKREYGSSDKLGELLDSPDFERLAMHFKETDLLQYLDFLGFSCEYFGYTTWTSREVRPLSGAILVCNKA